MRGGRTYERPPLQERLESGAIPEPNTGCLLWTRGSYPFGYGSISDRGRHLRTHRVSYELHIGPIPPGLFVCHRCDTPACIEPAHLFLGTSSENALDRERKGRGAKTLPPVPFGEKHPNAKLTMEQVRFIRSSAESKSVLAARFGVSLGTIANVQSGATYPEVAA